MKPLIRSFILTNGIVLCISLIALGSITVKQRSDYNMYRRDYSVLCLGRDGESITLNVDGKEKTKLDFSLLSQCEDKKDYLKFTPFGSIFFLAQTAKEFF